MVSWHETTHTAVAVLLGSDGKSWASCVLPTDAVHYAHPAVGAFPMKPATFAPDDYQVDWAPTENEDPAGTRGFVWQLVDKLDPEVARVEATLADGQEIGNDTTDGYIALGGAGTLPADAAWDKDYVHPGPAGLVAPLLRRRRARCWASRPTAPPSTATPRSAGSPAPDRPG